MYQPPSKTDLVAEDGTLKSRPRTYNEIRLDSFKQRKRFKKSSLEQQRQNDTLRKVLEDTRNSFTLRTMRKVGKVRKKIFKTFQ